MSRSGKTVVKAREKSAVKAVERPAIEEIARRYGEGESLRVLAKECGMIDEGVRKAIQRWCLTGEGDESYAQLVTRALAARIVDADAELERADNNVDVTKYAQVSRNARMDFERRRPNLYGTKSVNVNVNAVVADAELVGTMGELLERMTGPKLIGGGEG